MYFTLQDYFQQARIARGLLDRKVYTGPWHVQIDLTNTCNNDCICCWCNSPLIGDKAMPKEESKQTLAYEKVISLIDELAELGTRDIYFTGGGEPFMHPDILQFMRHVKSKGIRMGMSTNFTLVTKKVAEELVDIGIDHMNLSLWSATPRMYVTQHPSKTEETFIKMTESIDHINILKSRLGKKAPQLGMYNVINALNYEEVPAMLEYAFAHKLDDISYVPVDTIPEGTDQLQLQDSHLRKLNEMISGFRKKSKELAKKYGHRVKFANLDIFQNRIQSSDVKESNYDGEMLSSMPSCYAGWSFARILANGDVNSCLKSFKMPVGNINDDSFTNIWHGEKQQEFREHTIDYDIQDPYFEIMGNDRRTEGQGCYKCCDNLGLNLSIHEKMVKLGPASKLFLKVVNKFI